MVTCRDVVVAAIAVGATLCVVAVADQAAQVQSSTVIEWNSIAAEKTDTGEVRHFLKSPTATLDQLEVHVTTLGPGQAPHPPHQHPNEELLVVHEGTIQALVDGQWKTAGPGSVIFFASNQLHGVRNAGENSATYHVIGWSTPATPKAKPAP